MQNVCKKKTWTTELIQVAQQYCEKQPIYEKIRNLHILCRMVYTGLKYVSRNTVAIIYPKYWRSEWIYIYLLIIGSFNLELYKEY